MKWHCGLLSEQPAADRTLNWIKRGHWVGGLPADVERELTIWMAMPGFSLAFHSHTLQVSRQLVYPWMGGYDQLKAEVAENWLSATRDDCVRLAQLRPSKGELPVISQLQIMNDLKAGAKVVEIIRDYRTNHQTVAELRRGAIKSRRPLPSGFALLTNSIVL